MRRMLFMLALVAGCAKADAEKAPPEAKRVPSVPAYSPTAPVPTPAPPPATARKPVVLSAVTLADDCGGTAPDAPAKPAKARAPKAVMKMKAEYRCEQTSMQLVLDVDKATKVAVKSVELFDDTGKSLGKLASSKPRIWSVKQGKYETWNGKAIAGEPSNVTYVLAKPPWHTIENHWNRTYTVKVVVTLGGDDVALEKTVELATQTSLPPGVKT